MNKNQVFERRVVTCRGGPLITLSRMYSNESRRAWSSSAFPSPRARSPISFMRMKLRLPKICPSANCRRPLRDKRCFRAQDDALRISLIESTSSSRLSWVLTTSKSVADFIQILTPKNSCKEIKVQILIARDLPT